jgi:hypothetical protein
MSDLTATSLIGSVGLLHIYLYVYLDRVRKERQDQILTGVIQGVPISTPSRWIMLYTSWPTPIGVLLGTQVVMDVVYLNMADSVSTEGLRLLAYVFVLWGSLGALIYLVMAPLWFVHLRSILRQAEAD